MQSKPAGRLNKGLIRRDSGMPVFPKEFLSGTLRQCNAADLKASIIVK
jgi:hypothetical protein